MLLDLSQRNEITGDLFAVAQPVASTKLMGVLDALSARCSGQLIPDTVLSFSSAFAGASPLLN